MDGFLQCFLKRLNDHLSDETMAGMICGDLSFRERLIGAHHLAKCGHCRDRRDDLEGYRADRMMRLYRSLIESGSDAEDYATAAIARNAFEERLERHLRRPSSQSGWDLQVSNVARLLSAGWTLSFRLSAAACVLASLIGGAGYYAWWQQRVPQMSTNSLLVRAEKSETASIAVSSGAIFQSLRITTADQTIERSVYRDVQHKRRVRQVRLDARETQLRNTLNDVGVDWDEPISASGYQGWHDHQHEREDTIVRAGIHLLRLTTTVPEGAVAQQSLTVRDTDFHPVRRTVAFRDHRTVEIAELDFKVLPWSAVDPGAFEAAELPNAMMPLARADISAPLRMITPLTEGQLDEAELGARLVLNQLHADTGEQIEIDRDISRIEVRGVVDTDARKRELLAQLAVLPLVTTTIQSLADLKNGPVKPAPVNVSADVSSAISELPSPLESYLRSKGQSLSTATALAHRLFESVLAVSQESKALYDLQARFDPSLQESVIASATSLQLIYSHRDRLLDALRRERDLLLEITEDAGNKQGSNLPQKTLQEAAAVNLTLCKELTQANTTASGDAERIAAEMLAIAVDIAVEAHEVNRRPASDLALHSAEDGKQ